LGENGSISSNLHKVLNNEGEEDDGDGVVDVRPKVDERPKVIMRL